MKKIISTVLLTASAAFAGQASAAVFDFAAIAKNNEKGGAPLSFTVDGVSIKASGTVNGNAAYAYLDSSANTNADRAGLGVCGTLTGSLQCNPSSDDNVTFGEMLTISADDANTVLSLDGAEFRNSAHNGIATGTVLISVDGGAFVSYNMFGFNTVLAGNSFSFLNSSVGSNVVANEFYISQISASVTTTVSEPATMAMLGLGLFGLAAARRRSSK